MRVLPTGLDLKFLSPMRLFLSIISNIIWRPTSGVVIINVTEKAVAVGEFLYP